MKAMILAAGRGERMRPLTDTTPKPLLRVAGKPLIVWHIERLVAAGIRDIIINHAWLGHQIEEALGDGGQFGARLCYRAETTALETAGGIANALPFFQDAPFLVINGDIWCDWDPAGADICVQALSDAPALAWLLLTDNPEHNPGGDFLLIAPQGNDVRHNCSQRNNDAPAQKTDPAPLQLPCSTVWPLETRIQQHQNAQILTFTGIGIYDPALFSDIPPDQPAALAPLLRSAIEKKQVIATHHSGAWTDVGTPARLRALEHRLAMQGRHATL